MSTAVTYNEVQILGCLTERFEQEPVYDDSHTDKLYDRFTIRVSGLILGLTNQSSFSVRTSNADNTSATVSHKNIRYALESPRKAFKMILGADLNGNGGTVILQATGMPIGGSLATNIDLDNGPKPKVLSLERIVGDKSFRIVFEIVICKQECDAAGTAYNTSGVLNNRWACVDDIDKNWNTTRTWQGRLRCASGQINPHSFRDLVVPPLGSGMRRDRMTFAASPDGLLLDYTIVDKEVHYSAPPPAHSWELIHSEECGEGLISTASCSVKLEGDRMVDKKQLVSLAINILVSKLSINLQAQVAASNFIINKFSATDGYNDDASWVEVSMEITRSNDKFNAIGNATANVGRPYCLDPAESPAGFPRYDYRLSAAPGSAGRLPIVKAFIARLQTACESDRSYQTLGLGVSGV